LQTGRGARPLVCFAAYGPDPPDRLSSHVEQGRFLFRQRSAHGAGTVGDMLMCVACWCVSETGKGWVGVVAEDREDGEGPVVATYCPPCAKRELEATQRDLAYV
jgi:hypothetical protein